MMDKQGNKMNQRIKELADAGNVLFAVEEAIRNGDCPWQIEEAFEEYEAARKALAAAKEAGL